jgi:excisionase family DNA binding protein
VSPPRPQRSDALQQLIDQLDSAEANGVLSQARELLLEAKELLATLQEDAAGYMPTVSEAPVEESGRKRGRPKKWLSINDVASELGRNEQVVRRWVKAGKIPGHKIGSEYRILRQDFEEWVEEQRVKPPD